MEGFASGGARLPADACCACAPVQAFYLARTGRPGPVLIDVPKDVQQQLAVPDWTVPMAISGYMARLPQLPSPQVGLPARWCGLRRSTV